MLSQPVRNRFGRPPVDDRMAGSHRDGEAIRNVLFWGSRAMTANAVHEHASARS